MVTPPSRSRTPAALAALGAALALAAPHGARAAVAGLQDDRISVVPVAQVAARADLLARSRTRVTRVDLLWSEVASRRPAHPRDPADPAYDFSRWDAIAVALQAHGIRPILAVYSAPSWATGGRGAPKGRQVNPFAPPPTAFADFVQAVARRYSGRFRDPATTTLLPSIRHLELWNEPNLRGFLRVGTRVAPPAVYVRMVRAAYPAAKRGNGRSVVIVGAGGPRSSAGPGGYPAVTLERSLLRVRARMDAFSQHVYPAAGPVQATRAIPAWATLPVMIDALRTSRPRTPFLITEAGYTTARTPFRTAVTTPAVQARYLKQIFALPVVRRRVALVIWYQLQDNPDWPGGLRRASGATKPSWGAFRALARRGGIPAVLRR